MTRFLVDQHRSGKEVAVTALGLTEGGVALARMIVGATHEVVPGSGVPTTRLHFCSFELQPVQQLYQGDGTPVFIEKRRETVRQPIVMGDGVIHVTQPSLILCDVRIEFDGSGMKIDLQPSVEKPPLVLAIPSSLSGCPWQHPGCVASVAKQLLWRPRRRNWIKMFKQYGQPMAAV